MVRKILTCSPMFVLRLKTDHVEQRAQLVVLPELDDRIGFCAGFVRIGQTEGFHRAMAQSLRAALGHDFDRQAAVEIRR